MTNVGGKDKKAQTREFPKSNCCPGLEKLLGEEKAQEQACLLAHLEVMVGGW